MSIIEFCFAKVRISERNTKGKRKFFFLFPNESTFDHRSKLQIGEQKAKKKFFAYLYRNDKAFFCQNGIGEDALCFLEESCLIPDRSAEMTNAETFHPGITGKHGCLKGCSVQGLLCPESTLVHIGSFVIKQRNTLENIFQFGLIDCVGAIGVRTRRCCRLGKALMRDDGAIFCCP